MSIRSLVLAAIIGCVMALAHAVPASAAALSQPCYTDPTNPNTCIGDSTTTPLPVQGASGGTPVPVTPTVGTPTDRGGTITTGGSSQTLAAANSSRKCLVVVNPISAVDQGITTAENLYVNNNGVTASVTGGANYAGLVPGGSVSFCVGVNDQTAITVNAATSSHRYYAKEYQ